MNNKSKLIATALVLLGSASISFGQATASATATVTANIITPLTIAKTVDMNFGNIAVGANSGTVTMTPNGNRSAGGGVTLPAAAGSPAAATFKVDGLGSSTYAITLPTSVTLTNGSNTMVANGFTSTPSSTGTLTGGTQNITVGATLNVGAAQVAGSYVTAAGQLLTVTVCYN